MARGDGIAKKGHTKGKNLGDSGKSVGIEGGKAKRYKAGGISDEANDLIRPIVKKAKGGKIDGIAQRGKTKGKYI